jgi:hypothetical protein
MMRAIFFVPALVTPADPYRSLPFTCLPLCIIFGYPLSGDVKSAKAEERYENTLTGYIS